MKKSRPNPKANREILRLAYLVAGVFALMCLYLAFFLQFQSEEVINNPYNARLNLFEERIIRGSILSGDGTVLAKTTVGEDGREKREYPQGKLYSHVVGYSTVGKTGIESLANYYLINSHGNLIEQTMNELTDRKNTGDTVVTTLDHSLQATASNALADRRGAVIVMEPKTGRVLAMVSKPSYDPNTIAADWENLVKGDSSEAVLLNRATQGLYPPGSTFKLITALEYMREHPGSYELSRFDCDGIFEFESFKIQCYHKTAHGSQDFSQSFANSCNGAFASLGLEMDLGGMKNLAEQLLFNQEQPLSLAYSKSSYVMEADAGIWEILQTSIGQGNTLMTPMHNLMVTAAVANDGVLMTPYFIDHVENTGGQMVKSFSPSAYGSLMNSNEAAALQRLMTQVVTEGTGSALRGAPYTAAGKTGSAEFETGKETHAWFVGYAPAEDPEIAICVIVEEGGSGGQAAAPIARAVFDNWFSR